MDYIHRSNKVKYRKTPLCATYPRGRISHPGTGTVLLHFSLQHHSNSQDTSCAQQTSGNDARRGSSTRDRAVRTRARPRARSIGWRSTKSSGSGIVTLNPALHAGREVVVPRGKVAMLNLADD